jgi:putative transposase
MPHNRRNTRLPPAHYLGPHTYFVTICCDHRKRHLCSPVLAANVLQLLQQTAANHSFLLHAYCAMPDHLHLLAQGTTPLANLLEFVWQFKQQTAFAFRQSSGPRLWEKSYHDYVLRPSDSIERIAAYIWWNPVRKQICASPQDFPFTGSLTIDWMNNCAQAPTWSAPWKIVEPA